MAYRYGKKEVGREHGNVYGENYDFSWGNMMNSQIWKLESIMFQA